MADIKSILSLITLNISELNTPIQKQRLAEWILKAMIQLHAVYKGHIEIQFKSKKMRKYIRCKESPKENYSCYANIRQNNP